MLGVTVINKETASKKLNEVIEYGQQCYTLPLSAIILTKELLLFKEKLYNIADLYFGKSSRYTELLNNKFDISGASVPLMRKAYLDSVMSIAEAMKERIELDTSVGIDRVAKDLFNPKDPKKVFVVHGRDEKIRSDIFQFLRSIGLEPIEWDQAIELTGSTSPYIGDILDSAFSNAQAIIVLFTPDDQVKLKDDLCSTIESDEEKNIKHQPRPNVIFEAGMAIARNENRTIIVQVGEVKAFSDIAGRHIIKLNNSSERRQSFAQRLKNAGCNVVLSGTDWLSIGCFG